METRSDYQPTMGSEELLFPGCGRAGIGGHLARRLDGTQSPVPCWPQLCCASILPLLLLWWGPQELQGGCGAGPALGRGTGEKRLPTSHFPLLPWQQEPPSLLDRPHMLPMLLSAVLFLQKWGLNPELTSEMLSGIQVPLTALQVLLTPALPISRGSHLNCQSDGTGANGVMPSDHDLFLWLNLLKISKRKDLGGPKHPKQRQAGSNTTESTHRQRGSKHPGHNPHSGSGWICQTSTGIGDQEEGSFRSFSELLRQS